MPDLAIIILTYNNSRHIKDCLESIFKQYIKQLTEGKLELLVIDNNSTDDTVKIAKDYLSQKNIYKLSTIKVETNEDNRGFGAGLNAGAKHTKAPYILFMNPDSKLADGNIYDMRELLIDHGDIGIVGGKIISKNGKTELSAGKFLHFLTFLLMILGLERLSGGSFRYSPNQVQRVDFVSGGFMIVERALFEKLKGFDEKLFMYMEDMELCYRAYKKGYEVYFSPSATLEHESHGSSSRSFAVKGIYKGILYFYKKHKSILSYFLVKFILTVKAVILIIAGRLTGNKYLYKTYEEALTVC